MQTAEHNARFAKIISALTFRSCHSNALIHRSGASQVQLMRLISARGVKSTAPIAGLALLPASRLVVLGCEDGTVKVCA